MQTCKLLAKRSERIGIRSALRVQLLPPRDASALGRGDGFFSLSDYAQDPRVDWNGCEEGETDQWHWCDWRDTFWRDQTLDSHESCGRAITELRCLP